MTFLHSGAILKSFCNERAGSVALPGFKILIMEYSSRNYFRLLSATSKENCARRCYKAHSAAGNLIAYEVAKVLKRLFYDNIDVTKDFMLRLSIVAEVARNHDAPK
ncbi:hypothetical protein PRCB_22860 [Pantoea rodasii]|uniref:Uncharacterized protein n=1 Tax=Pantoea rodasii TaxID=1076549 RepID=A0A2M9W5V8_9GAMM|nr:hypothetical protein HA45_05415 [Pantoea rodasii]PJZ02921.1 hypothetical protein PRCB_22860 [Pantoea rodasii]